MAFSASGVKSTVKVLSAYLPHHRPSLFPPEMRLVNLSMKFPRLPEESLLVTLARMAIQKNGVQLPFQHGDPNLGHREIQLRSKKENSLGRVGVRESFQGYRICLWMSCTV